MSIDMCLCFEPCAATVSYQIIYTILFLPKHKYSDRCLGLVCDIYTFIAIKKNVMTYKIPFDHHAVSTRFLFLRNH